jgi:hypothetical protein
MKVLECVGYASVIILYAHSQDFKVMEVWKPQNMPSQFRAAFEITESIKKKGDRRIKMY